MEAIPERQLTVGVGGGLEAGFAESVGNTNFILSGIADASVTLGPVKLGAGAEATRSAAAPCWKGKGRITFGIPGLADFALQGKDGNFSDLKSKVGLKELGLNPPPSPKIGGASIGIKAAGKICADTSF